jgi:hypothetical protein
VAALRFAIPPGHPHNAMRLAASKEAHFMLGNRVRWRLALAAVVVAGLGLAPLACQITPSGLKTSMFSQYTTIEAGTASATEAAEAVLADLGLHEVEARSTNVDGWAKGLLSDKTPVTVTLERIGESDNLSQISVRVGSFGDTSVGQDIIARVRKKLGIEPPPPLSPSTAPSATTSLTAPPAPAPASPPRRPGAERIVAEKDKVMPSGRWALSAERAKEIRAAGERYVPNAAAGEPSGEWLVYGHSPAGWWDEEREDWMLVWKNNNADEPPDPPGGMCEGALWHWGWSQDFNHWTFSYACDQPGSPGYENASFFGR